VDCFRQNIGQASARNTGGLAANSPILLLFDDDIEADPELMSRHWKHHQSCAAELVVIGNTTDLYSCMPARHIERFLRQARERELAVFKGMWARQSPDSVGPQVHRYVCFGLNCSIAFDFPRLRGI
jgi:hypothetical protein